MSEKIKKYNECFNHYELIKDLENNVSYVRFQYYIKDVANYTDYFEIRLSNFIKYFIYDNKNYDFYCVLELYKKCNKIVDFKILEQREYDNYLFNKFKEDLEAYNLKNKLDKEIKTKNKTIKKVNKI